jgi:hypothetical protein
MPNSKNPGKGTNAPCHQMPVDDELTDIYELLTKSVEIEKNRKSFEKNDRLPPGVPLSERLFGQQLQNLRLYVELTKKYVTTSPATITVREITMTALADNQELIYMEAVWLRITNKK